MNASPSSASRLRRTAALTLAAGMACSLAPAAAGAAVATSITNDAGAPVAVQGAALRTMQPTIGIAAPASGGSYSATVTGPDGALAGTPINCFLINTNRPVDFRGNGTYTLTINEYAKDDRNCATPVGAASVQQFTIGAYSGIAATAPAILMRKAGDFKINSFTLNTDPNPGAVAQEYKYAANGGVAADGSITGDVKDGFRDSATGQVSIRPTVPGRYVVAARAKGFTGTSGGQFFSPWSPPVAVQVVAPFDIQRSRWIDSRGPTYGISVTLGEPSTRGRVTVYIARGSKGGKYRSVGGAKLSSKASFIKRFRLTRTGTYRIKVTYKGSATTAKGSAVKKFRITRRFAF